MNEARATLLTRGSGLALLLLPLATGCGGRTGAQPSTKGTEPVTAAVVTVKQEPWPQTIRIQGSLVADEESMIGSKVAGRLKDLKADRGSAVQQGQVLAELETEEFELHVRQATAQVEQIRAKLGLKPGEPDEKLDKKKAPPVVQEQALLEEARSNVERVRSLLRQNAGTVEELEKHEAALRVAEARHASACNTIEEQIALLGLRRAELALAKQHLADAIIRAPFAGIVQERHTSRGVYVQVGDSIVTVVRIDPLRFKGGVQERDAAQVQVDGTLRIHVEGVAEPLAARVTRISPALDLMNRSLVIEADVPNPQGQMRAGLFAQGDIVVDAQARVLAVPESAVSEFAGVEKVWLLKDRSAQERRVLTGRRERGLVEILDGLSAGDRVLADAERGRPGPVTPAAD